MDVATLQIRVESLEAKVAEQRLESLGRASAGAERAVGNIGNAAGAMVGALAKFAAGVFSAQIAYQGFLGVINRADEYANMAARVRLVTGSMQEQIEVQRLLFAQAQENRASLEETTSLYVKLAQSSKDLRGDQQALLQMTDTVSKALVVSGASASQSATAIQQFSQAMASGVLRGDEFNSIMENGFRLAQAIADGMGKPVEQLRKMAAEGQLTSKVITAALLNQSRVIETEFEKMPLTVGGAMQQVKNSILEMIGTTDQATGSSQELALTIQDLARTLSSPETKQAFMSIVQGVASITNEIARAIPIIVDWINKLNMGMGLQAETRGINAGDYKGNILDAFRGAGLNMRGRVNNTIGILTGDRARAITGRYQMAQGAERYRAGVLRGYYDRDWSDTPQNGRDRPASPGAGYLGGQLARTMSGQGRSPMMMLDPSKTGPRIPYAPQGATGSRTYAPPVATGGGGRGKGSSGKSEAGGEAERAQREAEREAERRQREFESVRESLLSEEEAMRESYDRRLKIIEENTAAGSTARTELTKKLKDQYDEDLAAYQMAEQRKADMATQGLRTEQEERERDRERQRQELEAALRDPAELNMFLQRLQQKAALEDAFEEERKAEKRDELLQTEQTELELMRARFEREQAELLHALQQKEIVEEEYLKRRDQLYRDHAERVKATERERMMSFSRDMEMAFGDLASAAREWSGEQSKTYKALFAIQKGFTIAIAALNIQTAISKAFAEGVTMYDRMIYVAQAMSEGARIMSAISSIRYAGAFDKGGTIGANEWGIVGEKGLEIVQGPAKVTSREQTAKLLSGAGKGVHIELHSTYHFDSNGQMTSAETSTNNAEKEMLAKAMDQKALDNINRETLPGGVIWRLVNNA